MGRKKLGKGISIAEYRRREWAKKGYIICFAPSDEIVCGNLGFGEWLKEARKEAGFTLIELAAKISYSPMTLSNWENEIKVS